MNIAVTHHSLNIPGGAERLCLAVIEVLKNRGYDVTLITVEKTDWDFVEKKFGEVTLPSQEIFLTQNHLSKNLTNISTASVYFLLYLARLLACQSKKSYDLIINTFGDVVNSIADITYVHFPLRAAMEFSQVPAFTNKKLWNILTPFYGMAVKALDHVSSGILLTNSKFMHGIIKKVLHRSAIVVYPPVNVNLFSSKCFKPNKAGNTVAIVASYTPKRHLEQIPLIAKCTRSAKFVVMGKADKYSKPTLNRLESQIAKLGVQDKISLLKDISFQNLLDVLSKAKVYLHVMPYDHFGISVVEAMSSGCVPVVHRSGGPWLDILDERQGDYGFSYETPREAAEYIDALIEDENLRSKIAERDLHRAKRFDKMVFMQKIVRIVEKNA